MKFTKFLLLSIFFASITGCSTFPLKSDIQDGHFRFENFRRDTGPTLEYVYLMCFSQEPTEWSEPRQFESGAHDLWVKASITERDILNSTREAYVNFDVTLAPGTSYMLNRKIVDDNISIWIAQADTGEVVSEVMTTDLAAPPVVDYSLRRRQCQSGSI